jgi:hypothetical protein
MFRSELLRWPSRVEPSLIRESQNTLSAGLQFCALLTEGGDPRVQLGRAWSSSMGNSLKSNFHFTDS